MPLMARGMQVGVTLSESFPGATDAQCIRVPRHDLLHHRHFRQPRAHPTIRPPRPHAVFIMTFWIQPGDKPREDFENAMVAAMQFCLQIRPKPDTPQMRILEEQNEAGPWGKVMYAAPFGIVTGVCFSKKMAELSSATVLALFRENEPPSELTRRPPLWLPFNAAGFDGFLETIERACTEVRTHYDEYPVGTSTEIGGPTDHSIIPEWFQVQEG